MVKSPTHCILFWENSKNLNKIQDTHYASICISDWLHIYSKNDIINSIKLYDSFLEKQAIPILGIEQKIKPVKVDIIEFLDGWDDISQNILLLNTRFYILKKYKSWFEICNTAKTLDKLIEMITSEKKCTNPRAKKLFIKNWSTYTGKEDLTIIEINTINTFTVKCIKYFKDKGINASWERILKIYTIDRKKHSFFIDFLREYNVYHINFLLNCESVDLFFNYLEKEQLIQQCIKEKIVKVKKNIKTKNLVTFMDKLLGGENG